MSHPLTPDGRYWVIKGRLWRVSNPNLSPATREKRVHQLMQARRDVKTAKATGDKQKLSVARHDVNQVKVALGERGPVWWQDGSQDFNRYLIKNTPYQNWYQ